MKSVSGTLADAAPVMIWVTGVDKRASFFNRRCLDFTGNTMEEKLGDGWARRPASRRSRSGTCSIIRLRHSMRGKEFSVPFSGSGGQMGSTDGCCSTGVPRYGAKVSLFAGYHRLLR